MNLDELLNGDVVLTSDNGEIVINVCKDYLDTDYRFRYKVWSVDTKLNNSVLEIITELRRSDVLEAMVTLATNADNYDMFMRYLLAHNYDFNNI